jgi:hypothetical protein
MPRASGASNKHTTRWLLDRPLSRAMTLFCQAASAFAFSGAVIAPEDLIAAISAAL